MNNDDWYEHPKTQELKRQLRDGAAALSQCLIDMLIYSDDSLDILAKNFHKTQGIVATYKSIMKFLIKHEENDKNE